MSKFRLGLSDSLLTAGTIDDINDLFQPAETIAKSGGFSRGPKAGHKYWRRQRIIVGGKLKWRYYYDNEKDRRQWVEDRAALIKRKRAKLAGHEKALARQADEAHGEGHTKGEHRAHNPDAARAARKELNALTSEYISEILAFDNPPRLIVSETAKQVYMQAVEDHFGPEGDPNDPHGEKLHALRMVEKAYKSLPPSFTKFFDGDIQSILIGVAADSDIKGMRGAAAYARYLGSGKTEIVCALDRMSMNGGGIAEDSEWGMYGMKGGAFGIEVLVHEMGHAFHNRMGAYSKSDLDKLRSRGWDRAGWDDWTRFVDENCNKHKKGNPGGKARGERGITKYAETNYKERWAETFTACLLYPKQMAKKCPKTYDWMRENVFGPEVMRPRVTDDKAVEAAKEVLANAKTPETRKVAQKALDMTTGVEDIPPGDPRFRWWENDEPTTFQKALSAAKEGGEFPPRGGAALDVHRVDPPDPDKIGQQKMGRKTYHDRFYEMNYKGRTVYFRYGPPSDGKYTHWEPMVEGRSDKFKASQNASSRAIKEAYDELGNPIHPDLIHLHLVQDDIPDGHTVGYTKIGGKLLPVTTDDLLAHFSGEATAEVSERVKKLYSSEGKEAFSKFLRTFTKKTIPDDLSAIQEAYAKYNALPDNDPERPKLLAKIEKLEAKANDASWDQGDSLPTPYSLTPHEVTHRQFKQRSGTFAYDNIKVKGQDILDQIRKATPGTAKYRKLLEDLRKVQPGLAITNRRNPKTGLFQRGVVKVDAEGRPVFNRVRYVNDNPDGSQTVIDCVRDPKTGRMTIDNPMWKALLTPNNEEIKNAADLEKYMRVAASEKRQTWVNIRTDRRRVQTRTGKWKMEKAGDTGHHKHLQVEFDGKGQPRLVGDYWKRKLGKETPRLDMLIKDDPVFGKFREGARAIIEGERISLKQEEEAPPFKEKLPYENDTFVLSVRGGEQRSASAKDKDIVVKLLRIIPGKKAGELPPAPGWDRMPEGSSNLPDWPFGVDKPSDKEFDKELAKNVKNKTLRAKLRKLKRDGVLPPHYTHDKDQEKWFNREYEPAFKEWNRTKEQKRQEEYDTQYVMVGEKNGGAVGQIFRRSPEQLAIDGRPPAPAMVAEALENEVLAYMHHTVDPVSGLSVTNEVRLVAPRNDAPSLAELAAMPGAIPAYKTVVDPFSGKKRKILQHVSVKVDKFHEFRQGVGGLSMTDDVVRAVEDRVRVLKAAERARRDESHVIEQEEIDPKNLARTWGVRLNETLPNGAKFTLGQHQQKLLQKMLDNDGRILGAHYMGTGKTVSALSAAQIMLRRPYREKCPEHLVGEERQKWLEENPWDTSRLHPDNPKRILVVAPLNTVEQWRQSAYDFDDGAQVVGSGSNDIPIDQFVSMSDDSRAEIVVVGPEYFTLHADKLKQCGFDGLVIDEVHMGIKNEEANRNKKVREWNADMKMMMLLTGTPMTTSPADFVEYVRILSKGTVWGDMTKAKFIEEYCQESDIPSKTGAPGAGPKVMIKPEKMAELAAILDQYMDIALPKDVRGKTLPATHIADHQHAAMGGVQTHLYNIYMAALSDNADLGSLTIEEIEKIKDEGLRRKSMAARAVTNCVGYTAGDTDLYLRIVIPPAKKGGKPTEEDFETLNPGALMDRGRGKSAGKWPTVKELRGGEQSAKLLEAFCQDVLGAPYSMLAGKPIGYGVQVNGKPADPWKLPVSKAQRDAALKRMKDAGWPKKLDNPEAGPLGVSFRGHGIPLLEILQKKAAAGDTAAAAQLARLKEQLDLAATLQREYRAFLKANYGGDMDPEEALEFVARRLGVSLGEAETMLALPPNPIHVTDKVTLTHGGVEVELEKGERFVSDQRGSLHLLYEREDWDDKANQPKAAGPATSEDVGKIVSVTPKGLKALGIVPPEKPKRPAKNAPEELKQKYRDDMVRWEAASRAWRPPKMQLVSIEGGKATLRFLDGPRAGTTVDVPEEHARRVVASLMDPGKRDARRRADLSMVHQNGKSDELEDHIRRFHDGQKPGADGERQMVLFGNGILDSCRTMEAKLRQMGFVDVNEAIEGSPHFDPDDPVTKGDPPSPTGKYFVTYIGSTYTGNRELNVSIFQKVKDKLNRDSDVSLFVHKCLNGKSPSSFRDAEGNKYEVPWQVYAGDVGEAHLEGTGVSSLTMAQWTTEQREVIKGQFGISPPESFLTIEKNGVEQEAYFYGKTFTPKERAALEKKYGGNPPLKTSGDLLRAMTLAGDPARLESRIKELEAKQKAGEAVGDRLAKLKKERADIVRKVAALKAEYTTIARDNHSTERPMTKKQETVFNNCEAIICSDAAQVGMNLGNSVEMVMYDSLGSPMAEAQRMTRCARMLPGTIPEDLMGTPVMVPKERIVRDDNGNPVLGEDGKPKTKAATRLKDSATEKIAKLRRQSEVTGVSRERKAELTAEMDRIMKDPANREKVMVQKTDELGRLVFKDDGPFTALRKAEADIFKVRNERSYNPGTISKVSIATILAPAAETPGGPRRLLGRRGTAKDALLLDGGTVPIPQMLDAIREKIQNAIPRASADNRRKLKSISGRIATASKLGGAAAVEMLDQLTKEVVPGTSDPYISFPKANLNPPDPEAGTYGGSDMVLAGGVENAVRDWIQSQDDHLQEAIMKAGFQFTEPGEASSHDPAAVYLAIRAQEILTWIEDNRPSVTAEMRAGETGAVITDNEITNRLIDMLSPMDRAILKEKKYLVNVRKLSAGGHVGQVEPYVWEEPDPETGKMRKMKAKVFAGYEREYPVSTETRTRATQRARARSFEDIIHAIQSGVDFKAEGDFASASAGDIASVSEIAALAKSVLARAALVFDLAALEALKWRL